MFYIQFLPLYDADIELLTLEVSKDVLTVNGVDLDFSPLKDGDVLPSSAVPHDRVVGDITRIGDDIQLTIQLPYHTQDAPVSVTFPDPVIAGDGKVSIPTDIFMEVTEDEHD